MQEPINYKDVVDLGFIRKEQSDSIFYDCYGFGYYLMSKKLYKGISAWWDINSRTVRIIRCNKRGDILGTILVLNLEELKLFIEFFVRGDK